MPPFRLALCIPCVAWSCSIFSAEQLGAQNLFDVSLQELLDTPVTSASQSQRRLKDAPGSVTVVTAAQIETMGARTLTDVLKTLPGMQLLDRRSGLDSIWIRGIVTGRNTKVLLLIDGIPQDEPVFSEWSPDESVPLNFIDRIEVIRGPGSALYGGNAYSGVISIFTRAYAPERSQVSVAAGNGNSKRLQWLSGIDAGDTQFVTSGSAYETDGYAMQRDRNGLPSTHDNHVSDYDLHARLISGGWQASLAANDFTTDYPLYSSAQDKQQEYRTVDVGVNYVVEGATTQVDNRFYLHHVDRRYDRRIWNPDGSRNFASYSDLDSSLYGLRSQLGWAMAEHQRLTAGATWQSRRVDDYQEFIFFKSSQAASEYESLLDDEGNRTPDSSNYALYLQQESDWFDDSLSLTAGLRYDHYQRWGGNLSPRAALTWHPQSAWSGKLLWGKAFRPPTLIEQFEVRSDHHSEGNPDLQPELIDTRELELSYRLSAQSNVTLRAFRSHLNDFIVTIDYRPYENIGTQTIPGQELEWLSRWQTGWALMRDLQFGVNLTHIDSNEASVARRMGNLSLTAGDADYSLSLTANYVGRRNDSATYHDLVTDPALRARDNKEAYLTLDADWTWKHIGATDWRLALQLHNLADAQRYDPSSEPDGYYDIRKEPRSVWLVLSKLL